MIACCSPSDSHVDESIKTLQYAAKARNIASVPIVHSNPASEQLLLPWSEKSKSSEQRSVYSKPEVQGICRDHILLKFEEKPSINVYICIDQSGTL
eukprot:jgi/Picre1/32346/NNA_007692.t1